MKNVFRLIRIITFATVIGFSMASCGDVDDPTDPSGGKTALATPANVRVDDAGKTAFVLKWDAVSGVDKYELDIGGEIKQVSETTTSYDLKALTLDPKVYPIRVRALAESGDDTFKNSAYSPTLNVEPADYMFTTDNASSGPGQSIQSARSVARDVGGSSAGSSGLTITGLTPYGKGLDTIVIPPKIGSITVTTIGANAFADSDIITSIKLPETVTEIKSGAFSNCTVLVIVVFVSVEPPALAGDVFEGSNALETIVVPDGSADAYAETIEEAAPDIAGKITETQPESFNITVNAANGGTIKTNPQSSALAGTTVTITVTPDSGYTLNVNSLRVMGADNKAVNVQQTGTGGYFFTMPSSDVTVSGTFTQNSTGPGEGGQPKTYKINISTGSAGTTGGGNIITNPQGSAEAEATVTIYINPDTGYTFNASSLSVKDANNRDVNYRNGAGGSAGIIYTFTMPASDVTISGTFSSGSTQPQPTTYNITILEIDESGLNGSGMISTDPQEKAAAGTTVKILVNLNPGYTLSELSIFNMTIQDYITYTPITGSGSTGGDGYTFTMPASNVEIKVFFAKESGPGDGGSTYKINTNTGSSGTAGGGYFNVDSQAKAGTTITFTVITNSGYTFNDSSLRVTDANGGTINHQKNTSGGYFFTMPASDVTISATFTQNSSGGPGSGGQTNTYNINTSTGSGSANGGVFNVSSQATAGTTVTFYAIADTGYIFNTSSLSITDSNKNNIQYQTVNGTSGISYSFTMPASDVTIIGSFTQNSTGGGGNPSNPGGGDKD